MTNAYHVPVLLNESVEGLNIKPDGIYVDATFGGGGHANEILKKIKTGKLIAFDQDKEAIERAPAHENLIKVHANNVYIENFLELHGYSKVDGVLADLGVSSYQIDTAERGFSTRFESKLDMRMNCHAEITAYQIINTYPAIELIRIFKGYGELNNAEKITQIIVEKRSQNPIETTKQLITFLSHLVPVGIHNKFFAKVFQALRIEVNNEIEGLKELLMAATRVLNKNGRLVFISYHSLEDRLVKNFFKTGSFDADIKTDFYGNKVPSPFKGITKKPILSQDEELKVNNRARSAKLRIAEKI